MAGALEGKVALVTGAASGIGRATALLLARHGAALAALDFNAEGLRALSAELGGHPHLTLAADLAEVDGLEAAVQPALDRFGRLDCLLNVAAYRARPDPLMGLKPQDWARTFAVNLTAPAKLIQIAGREMIRRGEGGRIVNVSSSSGFRAAGVLPAAYAVSKAAVPGLTRVAAAELGPYGINVNTVAPGATRTPMVAAAGESDRIEQMVREGPLANLLRRVSEPEDVAAVIVFLCLPESRQITGQTIHTSAGLIV